MRHDMKTVNETKWQETWRDEVRHEEIRRKYMNEIREDERRHEEENRCEKTGQEEMRWDKTKRKHEEPICENNFRTGLRSTQRWDKMWSDEIRIQMMK